MICITFHLARECRTILYFTRIFNLSTRPRLSPKEALLIGRDQWGQQENTLETPKFESRSINIGITTIAGKPNLVGTFNRPSNSKIDPDAASKVWFTFITPTIVTIRP